MIIVVGGIGTTVTSGFTKVGTDLGGETSGTDGRCTGVNTEVTTGRIVVLVKMTSVVNVS